MQWKDEGARKLTGPQRELVAEVLVVFGRGEFAIFDGEVCPVGLPGVEVVGAGKALIRRMAEFGAFVPLEQPVKGGVRYRLADWAAQHHPLAQAR